MASSIEFVVLTPAVAGQPWSRQVCESVSTARGHAAKRQHARERARRAGVLLQALHVCQDSALLPDTTQGSVENASKSLSPTGSATTSKPDEPEHNGQHVTQRIGILHNTRSAGAPLYFPSLYQPKATIFNHLKMYKRADQNSLVQYLQAIPVLMTGISKGGLTQHVRDTSKSIIHRCPAAAEWPLVQQEIMRGKQTPRDKTAGLARRARMYRKMQRMISHPDKYGSNELLDMAFGGTCVEYSTASGKDLSNVRTHYRGLQRMIESRGGLTCLFECSATMSHPIYCLAYFRFSELEVSCLHQARKSCDFFLETLFHIQTFVAGRGLPMIMSYSVEINHCAGSLPFSEATSSTRSAVSRYPSLRHLIHHRCNTDSFAGRVARFLSLYLMALIVQDFGHLEDTANKFLSKVSAIVDDWIDPADRSVRINSYVMISVIACAWVDVDASSVWPGSGPQKEIWITQAALDALRVFGRISDSRKAGITDLLADWICSGCGDSAHKPESDHFQQPLSSGYLSYITTECCSDWYEKRIALEQTVLHCGDDRM